MASDKEAYIQNLLDERGALEKAKAGDFSHLNSADIADVAAYTNSGIGWADRTSKVLGNGALAKVPFAGVGIAAWGGSARGERDLERMAYWFSDGNRALLKRDPTYRNAVKKAEEAGYAGAESASWVLGGSLSGAALAGLLTLNPIAAVAGAMAGGWATGSFHDSVVKDHFQDPVAITIQAVKMQATGEHVPTEVVFAALAANLQGKDAERVDKLLERFTGTKIFAEALSDPNNISKLQAMMNDPIIADAIRAQTGMIPDPKNPMKTVAEQYSELINNGHMAAKNLLDKGTGIIALSMAQKGVPNPEVEFQAQLGLPLKKQNQAAAGVAI